MNLKIGKIHEKKIEFTVSGISTGLANSIRRYCMVRVPILAIDNVIFYENSSPVFDDYLAHRLGLMPVITPSKLPKKTEVTFTLNETGPKIVYSGNLKSTDKEIKIAKDNIPIISLSQGQNIKLEGTTRLGMGTEHAKFQAGVVSYGIEGKDFNFIAETFYQMPPSQIVLRGCNELKSELSDLKKELSKKKKKK